MWRRALLVLTLFVSLTANLSPVSAAPVGITLETGARRGVYHVGERVDLKVTVDREAYLWIYNVSATGEMKQVFPNEWEMDNLLSAGAARTLPGTPAYSFVAAPPLGWEQVVVVALARLPGGADPTQAGVAVGRYEVRTALPGGEGPIL
jgi:hypothetical protein